LVVLHPIIAIAKMGIEHADYHAGVVSEILYLQRRAFLRS